MALRTLTWGVFERTCYCRQVNVPTGPPLSLLRKLSVVSSVASWRVGLQTERRLHAGIRSFF